MFALGMIGLVWWELRVKNPVMNLRLFQFKNFAICCFLMMLVGGVLNAATVLQPQFLQQLLGYTATNAGMALTAGGVALLFVMPLAGFATGKFAARNLAAVGFAFFAIAYYYVSTHVTLDMSFGEASFLRVLQMLPIPFCFIAITNAAYVGLPREASNQVSGLINFARNVGGSIFISVTNALVTNRGLFHQARLVDSMQPGNIGYDRMLHSLTGFFGGGSDGGNLARATIYNQLNDQAAAQGYVDVYRMLCWMSCGMVLCAFLLSKNRPGEGAPAGEAVH
jgi:DHA2 family multidrug resistance protein